MIRTIKFKMLALIAACLGLGAIALAWSFERTYQENAARLTQESIQGAAAAFGDVERTSVDLMSAVLASLARDPEVRAALASRDSARALASSQSLYRDYRTRFGITHWNFWEPEPADSVAPKGLRNILRSNAPDMHGDFVERITLARVARERRMVTGLDLGYTGLVLRVLIPVEEGNKLLGYLELGKEIGGSLQGMKKLSGNEYGLLVDKSRMEEKKWATTRATLGIRNNWADMPTLLLVENTTSDNEILRYDGKIDEVPDEGKPLEILNKGGRSLVRGVFPVRDVAGTKVGAVFVLRDITSVYEQMRSARLQAILAVVGLTVLLGLVLVAVFQVLVVRRLQNMIRVATRVVGGEFDLEIVPSAQDELGEFETLFEQFRMLFVELIDHAQRAETGGREARGGR
jgi:HAMP domain-containing protein